MLRKINVNTNRTTCNRTHGTDNSGIQQEQDSFHQQIGLKFKKETSEMLQFECNYLWC